MEGQAGESLEERVARLEREVAELRASLAGGVGKTPAAAPPPPPPPLPGPPPERAARRREELWAHLSEQWLGRVGLGLLFLGLVYLFNYSIQQGWLTPRLWVGVGLLIASALLAAGLRLQETRRSYSQLLLAGAVGVYYASGFAAYQLYELVSYGAAFAYMAAVMTLALALARRQDHPSLASLGAIGGFATPLLLDRASPAVVELSLYTALVVVWTAVLYWLRGWPTLVWSYTIGGFAALTVAVQHTAGADRWAVQGALLLTWAAGAVLPFVRGLAHPERLITLRRAWGRVPALIQLRVLGAGGTSFALLLVDGTWSLPEDALGGLFLAAAALYALLAVAGTRAPNLVAGTAAPVAAALGATGLFLVVDPVAARVVVLSLAALLFVAAGRDGRFPGLAGAGHALFLLLGADLVRESIPEPRHPFDPLAWAQLVLLGLAVAAARFARRPALAWGYLLGAHALFLLWLAKELAPLAGGTGLVSFAWGSYGALLLLLALRRRDRLGADTQPLQLVALSAIALTVLKLLLVDLDRVPIVWRICLFMGFGAALLGLSAVVKRR